MPRSAIAEDAIVLNLIRNLKFVIPAAGAFALVSGNAVAQSVPAAVTTALTTTNTSIVTVGGAVIGIVAAIMAVKWIQAVLI